MKTYNILHVLRNMEHFGGVQLRFIELISEPLPGFKTHVFTIGQIAPYFMQRLIHYQIPFRNLPPKSDWEMELIHYALESEIDLIHFHNPAPKVTPLLKDAGIKLIIGHDHGSLTFWPPKSIKKLKSNLKRIDGVIAASNASRLHLIKRLGYSPEKVVKIYDGVDFEKLKVNRPASRPSNKKIVATVCRLVDTKGVDTLLKSIPFILKKRNDVIFWLIGDGPLFSKLEQLANKLKIKKYITFWRNEQSIAPLLAATDLFVLPTIADALAGVLIEASYLGKPCITTNVDGNPEIIIHGKTGILLNPTVPWKKRDPYLVVDGTSKKFRKPKSLDPKILAKAIVNLLRKPKLCQIMGRQAHRRVSKLFNINRTRTELIKYYNQCITNYLSKSIADSPNSNSI